MRDNVSSGEGKKLSQKPCQKQNKWISRTWSDTAMCDVCVCDSSLPRRAWRREKWYMKEHSNSEKFQRIIICVLTQHILNKTIFIGLRAERHPIEIMAQEKWDNCIDLWRMGDVWSQGINFSLTSTRISPEIYFYYRIWILRAPGSKWLCICGCKGCLALTSGQLYPVST